MKTILTAEYTGISISTDNPCTTTDLNFCNLKINYVLSLICINHINKLAKITR